MAWYQTVSSVLCTRITLCYSKGSEPECRLQKQLPERGREGVLNKHFARVVWYGCVVLHPKNDTLTTHYSAKSLLLLCIICSMKNLRQEFFCEATSECSVTLWNSSGHLLNSHFPNPTLPHFINEGVTVGFPPPPRKKINSTDTVPHRKKTWEDPLRKISSMGGAWGRGVLMAWHQKPEIGMAFKET